MANSLPDGFLIRCLTCGVPEYQGAPNGPFQASRALHGRRALPVGVCGVCYLDALQAVYRSWLLRRFTRAQKARVGTGVAYAELVEAARQFAGNIGPNLIGVYEEHDEAIRERLGVTGGV